MPAAPRSDAAAAPGTGEPAPQRGCVAVAFSGGRDSLAMLHVACRAAAPLGLQVLALHVHHGLLPEADAWLRSAKRLCVRWRRRGWPLRLRWARLDGAPAPGDSLEAWARAGRHAALARLAQEEGATLLLLAHHRQDQAETFVLQALRGGGPAGLSAMPAAAERAGLIWARPWLAQPRAAIDAYVRRHRLQPLQDPSNDDERLARNRLRRLVWPALSAAFGDAEATLAAAARRAQEAAAALAELAAIDLAPRVDAQGRLQLAAWRELSAARQANALRAWWAGQTGAGPAQALVARLLAEAGSADAASWPAGAGWVCRLYRGQLQVLPPQPGAGSGRPDSGATSQGTALDLSRPGRWPVAGWSGVFEVGMVINSPDNSPDNRLDSSPGGLPGGGPCGPPGLPAALLRQVWPRPRSGGEQFQQHPGRPARSLKKQFQAAAVPATERSGPLLWSPAGALLFVPGLGADARHWAAAGEPARVLLWCPDAALSGPIKPSG